MDQFVKICYLVLICCFLYNSVCCRETSNCTISPETEMSKRQLDRYISDGENRLIRLNITVLWNNLTKENDSYSMNMELYMTTRQSGKRLLLLDKHFEMLSLWSLSHGVKTMQLNLVQGPIDCLREYDPVKAFDAVCYSLLTLPNSDKTAKDEENEDYNDLEVCNAHSKKNVCCKLNILGILECDEHLKDLRVKILEWMVYIILVLSVPFSLKCVPRSWYDSDLVFEFVDKRRQDENLSKQIIFSFLNANNLENINRKSNSKRLQDVFENIPKNKIEKIYWNRVGFRKVVAETDQLISEISQSSGLNYFFSRLMVFLSYTCLTCRVRNTETLKSLCYKKPFGKLYCYQCIGKLMKIILTLVCLMAILPRYIYVFKFGNKVILYISGSAVLIAEAIIVLVIFFEECKCMKSIMAVFKKRLYFVQNQSMTDRIKIFKKIVCSGCECNCKSIILAPFRFSVGCLYIVISFFPWLNFILALFSCCEHKCSKDKVRDSLISVCVSILTGFMFYSTLDMCYFYMLCLSYMFLGLIVNSSTVLPFTTFFLLMCSYMYGSFHDTHRKLDKFRKAVIKVLNETDKELVNKMYNLSLETRKNLVFLRQNNNEEEDNSAEFITSLDGSNLTRVPLFYKINKIDKLPYLHIPELFLHMLMNHPSRITPGSIYKMYCKNFRDIFIVFIILSSALYGVTTFGNVHGLSSGVQTLVTIATGSLMLFFFNKVLSRTRVYEIDDKGLHLKQIIKEVSKTYNESWNIEDCTQTDTANEPEVVQLGRDEDVEFYFINSKSQTNHADTNYENIVICGMCCRCCYDSQYNQIEETELKSVVST